MPTARSPPPPHRHLHRALQRRPTATQAVPTRPSPSRPPEPAAVTSGAAGAWLGTPHPSTAHQAIGKTLARPTASPRPRIAAPRHDDVGLRQPLPREGMRNPRRHRRQPGFAWSRPLAVAGGEGGERKWRGGRWLGFLPCHPRGRLRRRGKGGFDNYMSVDTAPCSSVHISTITVYFRENNHYKNF